MLKYLLIIVSLVGSSSAFAESRFSLVGGIDYSLDSVSSAGVTAKGGLGFGGGALIGFNSLELGALYFSRPITATVTVGALSASVSTTYTVIEIPLMYRFGSTKTFGLGAFFDMAGSGGASNFGVTAGPRLGGANGGLFLDLRFNYGLQSGGSKDILALLGYGFGGKGK